MNINIQYTQTENGMELMNINYIKSSLLNFCLESYDIYNICIEVLKEIYKHEDLMKIDHITDYCNKPINNNNIPLTNINNIPIITTIYNKDSHIYIFLFLICVLYFLHIYINRR
jgi:hypothetical protein